MAEQVSIGTPLDEAEMKRLGEVVGSALQFPPELVGPYYANVGHENIRVIRVDHEVAGGLAEIPMGQYFGGRAIPMVGIAAVGIAPHMRSRGVALRLMQKSLEEMRARGVPLSTLYPATQPLYRKLGYEVAGAASDYSVPMSLMDVRDRTLNVRPIDAGDLSRIAELYNTWAARNPGQCERGEFIWNRVRKWRGVPQDGYVFCRGEEIEGYVYYKQVEGNSFPHKLRLNDYVVATPAAARRMLTFLADHASMANAITWRGGPLDALLLHLREQEWEQTESTMWMLRIVDVGAALRQRGFSGELRGELHLKVHDAGLPENAGDYVLHVADGRTTVERGGGGELRLDVRGLAAMYSGFLSAESIALAGLAEGRPEVLARATALFHGPTPWMRDAF